MRRWGDSGLVKKGQSPPCMYLTGAIAEFVRRILAHGDAVEDEGCWACIVASPGAVEAQGDGLARCDGAVVAQIGDRDYLACLGKAAAPELSNLLIARESEL